jgi:hypothetical protein
MMSDDANDPGPVDVPGEKADSGLRAHAPHHRFEKSLDAVASAPAATIVPSKQLHPDGPEVLERLEALDDAVYGAMDGPEAALERLKTLWPATLATLGETLVADSREQYLRYALWIWENGTDAHGVHDPLRAIRALDVLCVLFEEE